MRKRREASCQGLRLEAQIWQYQYQPLNITNFKISKFISTILKYLNSYNFCVSERINCLSQRLGQRRSSHVQLLFLSPWWRGWVCITWSAHLEEVEARVGAGLAREVVLRMVGWQLVGREHVHVGDAPLVGFRAHGDGHLRHLPLYQLLTDNTRRMGLCGGVGLAGQ